jgi:hypothetical protein
VENCNHPGARRATPPESGGEFLKPGSPPQMRRGGARGDGVVVNRKPVPIRHPQKLAALEELKKSLLDQAFSGEL